MKIKKATKFFPSFRTGTINADRKTITQIVGFEPDVHSDPDKVTHEWRFTVDGIRCAIWDYKGSAEYNTYSCYMPVMIGKELFGSIMYRSEHEYRNDV
jgi:hypothetical protein